MVIKFLNKFIIILLLTLLICHVRLLILIRQRVKNLSSFISSLLFLKMCLNLVCLNRSLLLIRIYFLLYLNFLNLLFLLNNFFYRSLLNRRFLNNYFIRWLSDSPYSIFIICFNNFRPVARNTNIFLHF
jgi:hypothetical protein